MKVSTGNIQKAIEQHYHSNIGQADHIAAFGHEKVVKVIIILNELEKLPGYMMAEVLAVAHLAAMNQISEESR